MRIHSLISNSSAVIYKHSVVRYLILESSRAFGVSIKIILVESEQIQRHRLNVPQFQSQIGGNIHGTPISYGSQDAQINIAVRCLFALSVGAEQYDFGYDPCFGQRTYDLVEFGLTFWFISARPSG